MAKADDRYREKCPKCERRRQQELKRRKRVRELNMLEKAFNAPCPYANKFFGIKEVE